MKLDSLVSTRSSNHFQSNSKKLRWMEWLIAIFFVVSLLIGSGVFVKAGNAASLKEDSYKNISYDEVAMIPGPMRTIGEANSKSSSRVSKITYIESEDSCELKKVDS